MKISHLTASLCFVFLEWEVPLARHLCQVKRNVDWSQGVAMYPWSLWITGAEHRLRWCPPSLGGGVHMEVRAEHFKSHLLLPFLPPPKTWLNSNTHATLLGYLSCFLPFRLSGWAMDHDCSGEVGGRTWTDIV